MSSESIENDQIDEYRKGLRSSLESFLVLTCGMAAAFVLLFFASRVDRGAGSDFLRGLLVAAAPAPGEALSLQLGCLAAVFTLVIPLALIPRSGQDGASPRLIAFAAWLTIVAMAVSVLALVTVGLAWFGVTPGTVTTLLLATFCALIVAMVTCGMQALEMDEVNAARNARFRSELRDRCAVGVASVATAFAVASDIERPSRRIDGKRVLQVMAPSALLAILFGIAELIAGGSDWSLLWRIPAVSLAYCLMSGAAAGMTTSQAIRTKLAQLKEDRSTLIMDRVLLASIAMINTGIALGAISSQNWLASLGLFVAVLGPILTFRLAKNGEEFSEWFAASVIGRLRDQMVRLSTDADR